MKYSEYMELARECSTYEEADALINTVAEDYTISARKYETIRHTAIEAAYNAQ